MGKLMAHLLGEDWSRRIDRRKHFETKKGGAGHGV